MPNCEPSTAEGPLHFWHPDRERGVDHELIWSSIIVFGLAIARFVPRPLLTWYPCRFKKFIGLPCPTCGTTRATLHSVRLEFADAFQVNPLASALLILAVLYAIYSVIVVIARLPRARPNLEHSGTRFAIRVGLPAILLVNWVYLIVHGT